MEMFPSPKYLVDLKSEELEPIATDLFLRLINVATAGVFWDMGLVPSLSWYLVGCRKSRLSKNNSESGDLDVIAGRLLWRDQKLFEKTLDVHRYVLGGWHPDRQVELTCWRMMDQEEPFIWPPKMDHLVVLEIKACALPRNAAEISARTINVKDSNAHNRKIYGQVASRFEYGFDRVSLLEIVATPPVGGHGIQPWIHAGHIAASAFESLLDPLKKRFSNEKLGIEGAIGHWIWPKGSVEGKGEKEAGSGSPILLRHSRPNPQHRKSERISLARKSMEQSLSHLLQFIKSPRSFPVILKDCQLCGDIHWLDDPCAIS